MTPLDTFTFSGRVDVASCQQLHSDVPASFIARLLLRQMLRVLFVPLIGGWTHCVCCVLIQTR